MRRSGRGSSAGDDRERLLRVVRRVRNRWRLRTLLRGLGIVAGVGLAAFLLTAYGLEYFRFAPEAIVAFRVLTYLLVGVVAYAELVRPLFRRVDDEQVALYLEEHEPSLESSVLTAVGTEGEADDPLLDRLVGEALQRTRDVEYGARVERGRLYRYSGLLAGVGVVGVFLFLLGPGTLRTGASALLFPNRGAEDLTPFSIRVNPGDSTVARGSDPVVRADLVGFDAGEVELVTLAPDGSVRDARPMFPAEEGGFEYVLLGLEEEVRYFVRSSGVRSGTYTLDVAEIPYVETLELVYHFPDYTGLEPRTVEDGGNIAVLPGTRVEFRAASSVPTSAGRLVLDDSSELSLRPDSTGRLVGELVVEERNGYRVELERPDGRMGAASPHYTIDLLRDQPPSVSIEKPGRDTRATPIEEVFLQVEGEDDYGLGAVDLVYSVNGEAEDTVGLIRGAGDPPTEVSAGHTFFLEEWDLVPGDLISYYAVARDNDRTRGPSEAVTDIYFLAVQAFDRNYSAAQGGGGGGGGGGPAGQQGAFVEVQRQIVAATFNLLRDRDGYPAEEWSSDLANVTLSQERLRDDVSMLVDRIRTRISNAEDEAFQTISRELPRAMEAMEEAIAELEDEDATEALPAEQRALIHLQRADQAYRDVQVSLQQGGGGGGGARPQAEDLADLFELELDKLRDQYETVQRGQRESARQDLDETMERLRELARRQQQEADRRARQLAAGGGAPSSASRQQQLAEQTEEVARRLERLAREQDSRELEETARSLREAVDEMRRAAAENSDESAGAAQSAAERLEEARRLLDEGRAESFREDVGRALDRARRLRDQQERIARDAEALPEDPTDPERRDALGDLIERKEEMAEAVDDLTGQLDRAAARARREDREAARPLEEAAAGAREDQLPEKIRFSRSLLTGRDRERSREFEEEIRGDLESLVESLEEAERAAARSTDDDSSLEDALRDARSLTRGMETLQRRLRNAQASDESGGEAGDRAAEGQAGQPRDARQGDSDRQGQQGRAGRQDRSGQDQQARSGQQQGQQGQQGQSGQQQGRQGQQGGGAAGQPSDGADASAGRAGGQPGADGRTARGGPAGGFGAGGPRGGLDEEGVRQLRREFGERARDAAELRDRLREAGRETGELDQVVEALQSLEERAVYSDMAEVRQLQDQIVESLRSLEFELRRELETSEGRGIQLPGAGDVPPEFRELVEEYYRVLSEGAESGG